MTSMILANNHALFRKGLRTLLSERFPGATFTEADSMTEVMTRLQREDSCSVAFLDLQLPGLSIQGLKAVRSMCPGTKLAILSASDSREDVAACFAAGVHGYISKLQSEDDIASAVFEILSGRIYLPSFLSELSTDGEDRVSSINVKDSSLTRRQKEVLGLISRGMSNKEIARLLAISTATTKIHTAALLRSLGVRNRTEAAILARTRGDMYGLRA